MMKDDEISEPNLIGLLSIIGADCECGLDVAWTLGTRLPVRWDDARHARVAARLGFDPDNPLVKLEVSRLVGRSRSVREPDPATSPVVLASDPVPQTADRRSRAVSLTAPKTQETDRAPTGALAVTEGDKVACRALGTLLILFGAVLAVGLFVLGRAARRRMLSRRRCGCN